MLCPDNKRRAIGVSLAQYPQTMPLSGISQADIVIEWPVANAGGVTRLLAIYQCYSPKEIGSIRSVRPYVIDLSLGFDAILVSWGGASSAIARIGEVDIDWLDGRVNPSGAFFRKTNKPAPHNGFASSSQLRVAAKEQSMRLENEFKGYKFLEAKNVKNKKKEQVIKIDYYYPVKYVYDKKTGNYLRYWNREKAIDNNTDKQVFAKNVVLLKTYVGVLSAGVADAEVVGSGEAKIYQAGRRIDAKWQKKSTSGRLLFFDQEGEKIKFVPGPIWIAIVDKF
jgi:hypothetical protein